MTDDPTSNFSKDDLSFFKGGLVSALRDLSMEQEVSRSLEPMGPPSFDSQILDCSGSSARQGNISKGKDRISPSSVPPAGGITALETLAAFGACVQKSKTTPPPASPGSGHFKAKPVTVSPPPSSRRMPEELAADAERTTAAELAKIEEMIGSGRLFDCEGDGEKQRFGRGYDLEDLERLELENPERLATPEGMAAYADYLLKKHCSPETQALRDEEMEVFEERYHRRRAIFYYTQADLFEKAGKIDLAEEKRCMAEEAVMEIYLKKAELLLRKGELQASIEAKEQADELIWLRRGRELVNIGSGYQAIQILALQTRRRNIQEAFFSEKASQGILNLDYLKQVEAVVEMASQGELEEIAQGIQLSRQMPVVRDEDLFSLSKGGISVDGNYTGRDLEAFQLAEAQRIVASMSQAEGVRCYRGECGERAKKGRQSPPQLVLQDEPSDKPRPTIERDR